MKNENDRLDKIRNVLEVLKSRGIRHRLCCLANGHIQAKSAHGVIYNFYATTGTIVGHPHQEESGLEYLLYLLDEY